MHAFPETSISLVTLEGYSHYNAFYILSIVISHIFIFMNNCNFTLIPFMVKIHIHIMMNSQNIKIGYNCV